MTKKLSAFDRQRVSTALTKCAAATKDIESGEELGNKAYSILSEELGDNPGLFKAACQVYNSCKSIHKLASSTDDTRGDSFSILNVQDMCARLSSEKQLNMRKAASAPATFSKAQRPVTTSALHKAASAAPKKSDISSTLTVAAYDAHDYRSYLLEELADAEAFVRKTASALRRASDTRDSLLDAFISAMATEPRDVRKEAAARLFANYGLEAEKVLKAFNTARPLQKLAAADYADKFRGTPSLPRTRTITLASQLLDAERDLRNATVMHSVALEKTANMLADHARAYVAIRKSAKDSDKLLSTALKADLLKDFTEGLGLDEDDKINIAKEVLNTEFVNRMIAHSHRRAFMRALQNPAIAKYPIDKVLEAFNTTIPKLPISHRNAPATLHQSLIESQMMNALATGSVPSKADTELIATLANTVGKINPGVVVSASNISEVR